MAQGRSCVQAKVAHERTTQTMWKLYLSQQGDRKRTDNTCLKDAKHARYALMETNTKDNRK